MQYDGQNNTVLCQNKLKKLKKTHILLSLDEDGLGLYDCWMAVRSTAAGCILIFIINIMLARLSAASTFFPHKAQKALVRMAHAYRKVTGNLDL